jgi:hypothetical protein
LGGRDRIHGMVSFASNVVDALVAVKTAKNGVITVKIMMNLVLLDFFY